MKYLQFRQTNILLFIQPVFYVTEVKVTEIKKEIISIKGQQQFNWSILRYVLSVLLTEKESYDEIFYGNSYGLKCR